MIENGRDRRGTELAGGRYKIIDRIGSGSMGEVYRAQDRNLGTDVVIKFPVAADQAMDRSDLLERFHREIKSLVRLSHPHVVKVIDVGEAEGSPYVVLQYLSGGTLKDRLAAGPAGEPRAMPPESLHRWLPDVARALDFVHAQGHIHRDVKPANIIFDGHGNAFLGDFGIIKALASDLDDAWRDNSLTAPGFLLGTPGYVAPEIVMGEPPDGRSDQYALALTVHEVLTGHNLMAGPSPSATIVNQTKVDLPLLCDLVPRVPRRAAEAVRRGLSKSSVDRFPSCAALAQEILAEVPAVLPHDALETETAMMPGVSLCPHCYAPVPVGEAEEGDRVRCGVCQSTALVRLSGRFKVLSPTVPTATTRAMPGPDRSGPGIGPTMAMPSARPGRALDATMHAERIAAPSSPRDANRSRRRLLLAMAPLGLLAVGACAWIAGQGWFARRPEGGMKDAAPAGRDRGVAATPAPMEPVEINIAFGTEKAKWLEAARHEFENTPAGSRCKINLMGMGSVEGARAILAGDKPVPIHVWSPASAAYRDVFVQEWKVRHGKSPILRTQDLALTPMVFVLWKSRHDAFIAKYGKVSFRTLGEAMAEPGGWGSIAGKPEWGLFKFGHTHPNQSNSGMLALMLMAYEFAGKQRDLSLADVTRPDFQEWFGKFERSLARHGGSLTHSTGTLMQEMVKRGPSQYDALLVYENLAVEFVKIAREHWGDEGELRVVYPELNIWNDHPYYILDVPWSSAAERRAAADFLAFLMTEPIQRLALRDGFRPGNLSVSPRFPGSPLIENERYGVRVEIALRLCEPPRAEVLSSLLASFQRIDQ